MANNLGTFNGNNSNVQVAGMYNGTEMQVVAMENNINNGVKEKIYRDDFESFPSGYRFKPRDNELIVYYLMKKVYNEKLPPNKIPEVNIYLYHPNQLASMYTLDREREWYFFSPREKKYPNGSRPKRSAGNGYWKPTGKEKPIKNGDETIGFVRGLDFLVGKQPNGQKTNWKMHEYKLHQQFINPSNKRSRGGNTLDDWVLCKLYKKREQKKEDDNNTDDEKEISTSEEVTSNDSSAAQISQQNVADTDGFFNHNFGGNNNGFELDPFSNNGVQNYVTPVEPPAGHQVSEAIMDRTDFTHAPLMEPNTNFMSSIHMDTKVEDIWVSNNVKDEDSVYLQNGYTYYNNMGSNISGLWNGHVSNNSTQNQVPSLEPQASLTWPEWDPAGSFSPLLDQTPAKQESTSPVNEPNSSTQLPARHDDSKEDFSQYFDNLDSLPNNDFGDSIPDLRHLPIPDMANSQGGLADKKDITKKM